VTVTVSPPPTAPRPAPAAASVGAAVVLVLRLRAGPALTYVTQPVVRTTLVQTVTAEGTVNRQNLILVGTQVSGTISELDVDYNSPVRVGQVMAKLDPTTFRDALAGAGASHGQFTQQYGAGIAAAQSAAASVSSDVAAARAALASGTRTLRSGYPGSTHV